MGWFKKKLYFLVANYFRFFAIIQLAIWKPRIIVITGSSGKTTLLNLIESQIRDKARYSHQANSSFGIPFDILGLHRTNLMHVEWIYLFLAAPLKAFKFPYKEKLYIVEADCDRPHEGKFLAMLLKPEVTLWVSCSRTHSMNFDNFPDVDGAIADEFGFFLENTTKFAIVNGDSELISKQLNRLKVPVETIQKKGHLNDYKIVNNKTEFEIDNKKFAFNVLLPEEVFYAIAMLNSLTKYLGVEVINFEDFSLPPGRSSVFSGIKNTTIIDSTYNATPDGMAAILHMFNLYPSVNKWVVIGDMIELGNEEQEEHEKLAEFLASVKLSKIILMGPRVVKYTYPKLQSANLIEKFIVPKEALDCLEKNIAGGEVILFKGARFLEGVIEHLLADKNDATKLCRREKAWQIRRQKWGL